MIHGQCYLLRFAVNAEELLDVVYLERTAVNVSVSVVVTHRLNDNWTRGVHCGRIMSERVRDHCSYFFTVRDVVLGEH